MKQLTTKKIYLYLAFQNLKRTPPREYPDTNEMMVTVDEILPALETASGEFVGFSKEADDINTDLATNKISQEEARTKIEELQKRVGVFEKDGGMAMVTAEMSPSAFGIFVSQFERWGKGDSGQQRMGWFNKIEDLVAFKKDVAKANV